jgi:hypothetical protein
MRFAFSTETRNIYESLELSEEDSKDPDKVMEAMEEFAKGLMNETLERHNFYTRNQEEGEKFDEYLTDIVMLSKSCNFCVACVPGMIRDKIVNGILDNDVRRKLLQEKKLTEVNAIEICRANEKASEGMKSMKSMKDSSRSSEIDAVRFRSGKGRERENRNRNWRDNSDQKAFTSTSTIECKFCNRQHVYGRNNCKAFGKRCNDCKESNHFAGSVMCKKKGKRSEEDDEEQELSNVEALMNVLFLGSVEELEDSTVGAVAVEDKKLELDIFTGKGTLTFKVDTGADVTVIGTQHLDQFGYTVNELRRTKKRLNVGDTLRQYSRPKKVNFQ